MSSFRGHDNFTNSKQYIIGQLFVRDYSDDGDLNLLKMKIWALDGAIMDWEGITDTDVTNPKDHFSTLQNDLVYFDKYIRTEEDTLAPLEPDFDTFWQARIDLKEVFTHTKKPGSEDYYQDWEQPYSQRPTLLLKSDFTELYVAYLAYPHYIFGSAFEITTAITTYCIDHEVNTADIAVETDRTPAEIEADLLVLAAEAQEKNDKNYVIEMIDQHTELWGLVQSVLPSTDNPWVIDTSYSEETIVNHASSVYKCILAHTSTADDEPDVGVDWEDYWEELIWTNSQVIICNLPTLREQVEIAKPPNNHKGPIIRLAGFESGGYRFSYRDSSGNEISLPVDPLVDDFIIDVSPDNIGQLEDTWDDFVYAHYYEEENVDEGTITAYLTSLGVTKNSLSPADEARFDVLNTRWINENNLREYQILDTGTRNIIESMCDAEIPLLKPSKESHLADKKEQKKNYTEILQEQCPEFI